MSYTLIGFVERLNIQLFEQGLGDGEIVFSYEDSGFIQFIKMNNVVLWNSDTDTREWDEDLDRYKLTVEEYVLEEFKSYRDQLNSLSLTVWGSDETTD